jgi:hypothetical protein
MLTIDRWSAFFVLRRPELYSEEQENKKCDSAAAAFQLQSISPQGIGEATPSLIADSNIKIY